MALESEKGPTLEAAEKAYEQALDKLQKTLEYTFKNPGLLRQATTRHGIPDADCLPYGQRRLAQRGDALLRLLAIRREMDTGIASLGTDTSERELLLQNSVFAKVSFDLGLHHCVRPTSDDLATTKEDEKIRILADTFEAIFGAMDLDSDGDTAKMAQIADTQLFTKKDEIREFAKKNPLSSKMPAYLLWGQAGEGLPYYSLAKYTKVWERQNFDTIWKQWPQVSLVPTKDADEAARLDMARAKLYRVFNQGQECPVYIHERPGFYPLLEKTQQKAYAFDINQNAYVALGKTPLEALEDLLTGYSEKR